MKMLDSLRRFLKRKSVSESLGVIKNFILYSLAYGFILNVILSAFADFRFDIVSVFACGFLYYLCFEEFPALVKKMRQK